MNEGEMGRWWGRREWGKAGEGSGGGEIEGDGLGVGGLPTPPALSQSHPLSRAYCGPSWVKGQVHLILCLPFTSTAGRFCKTVNETFLSS